jgi:putative transcriptional regulator
VLWNLRMRAAERGIWKSSEMRRALAEAGLAISAGKMSMLWTSTPTTVRLDDLEIICSVLDCEPSDLFTCEADVVAARRAPTTAAAAGDDTHRSSRITPRLGRNRTLPPA